MPEEKINLKSGASIHIPAYPETLTYVRIENADGETISNYSVTNDLEQVLSYMLGDLVVLQNNPFLSQDDDYSVVQIDHE